MSGLIIEGLCAGYGDTKVLEGLDLEIGDGQVIGIIGESGSGKTTLLRCIAGFERPTAGRISIGGNDAFNMGRGIDIPPQKRGVTMVFQDLALWPHLSCRKHLEFVLGARQVPKSEWDDIILGLGQSVSMETLLERAPGQLSGGEKQRLAIMRALAQDPSVLLLDEPLSNLNQSLRQMMKELFQSIIAERSLTTVYVTHDLCDLDGFADRIVPFE